MAIRAGHVYAHAIWSAAFVPDLPVNHTSFYDMRILYNYIDMT